MTSPRERPESKAVKDVARLRKLFPVVERATYLNHAGTGPLPLPAMEAMRRLVERQTYDGDIPYPEAEAVTEDARRMAAKLLGARREEVAFTKNTTAGLLIAIGGIAWEPGDNIIVMRDAFPADSYPYRYLLSGIDRREVTSAELAAGPECVFRLADRRTRAVALDWVSFLAGVRADIAAVGRFCRERDIRFIVDAIQGLGAVRADFAASGADFAAAGGNKWLLGPQGIGVLYVSSRVLPAMRPVNLGWLSAEWESFEDVFAPRPLKPGAHRFEEGTKNYLGIYGLRESLRLLLDFGPAEVEERIRMLTGRLRQGVERLGFEVLTPAAPERSAGIIACRRPGADMAALHRGLVADRFALALRQGWLRVAPHFYNTEEEIDRLLARLADETGREFLTRRHPCLDS